MEATKKMKTCELSGLYLYSETDNNGNKRYYLRAHYDVEDEFRKTEIIYPKIHVPIYTNQLLAKETFAVSPLLESQPSMVDIGFGFTRVERDPLGNIEYTVVKEEKAQKMTLSEIEKKLGHKIILVNEGK